MKTALVIVDMQQGSFTGTTPRHDCAGLIGRLNALAGAVRAAKGVVVFVQHDGPPGDAHHPESPGWKLLPALRIESADLFVRKASCDAFLDTNLEALLQAHEVRRLIITGCATDFCVDTTVRSALARRYPTIVPADGHTTANRPHMTAEKIIEHHNAIWAAFIAPCGPAILCPCSEVGLE